MSTQTIEERLAAVETELQELKREREQKKGDEKASPGGRRFAGSSKMIPIT